MNKWLIFAGGLVAGGVAGYLIARIQYKKEIDILNKELDESVDAEFNKRFKKADESKTKDTDILGEAEQRAYKERMDRYSGEEYEDEELEEGPVEYAEKPYVITYEEFANEHIHDFDKETLTYYEQDDVLVNDSREILNVEFYIGRESLEHVGEQEKDCVHVRNEKHCVDYEVQVTHAKFREEG